MFGMLKKTPKKGEILPSKNAKTSQGKILELANSWAKNEGILWSPPYKADYHYDEPPYWTVKSNASGRGGVIIKIDDDECKVLEHHVLPR